MGYVGRHEPMVQIDVLQNDVVRILAGIRSRMASPLDDGEVSLDDYSRNHQLMEFFDPCRSAMLKAVQRRGLSSKVGKWAKKVLAKNGYTGDQNPIAGEDDIDCQVRGYQLVRMPKRQIQNKRVIRYPFSSQSFSLTQIIETPAQFSFENPHECDRGASWIIARARTLAHQAPEVYEGLAVKVWQALGEVSEEVWSSLLRDHIVRSS